MQRGIIAALLTLALVLVGEAAIGNSSRVISKILVSEGGASYTNHPNDPGGPTKYGVTIHDVRKYINPHATAADVKRLTEAEAIVVFKAHYWDVMRGEELPLGLDYSVVDYAVNAGVGRAGADLRRVLGLSTATWRVTDEVIAAILKYGDIEKLIHRFNARRMQFQMGLGGKYIVFHRGWRNRIRAVDAGAIRMRQQGIDKALIGDDIKPQLGPGKAYDPELEESNVQP